MESTWTIDPVAITIAAAGLVLYAQAFVRLRARAGATHADAWRAALFTAGVGVTLLALVSPLDAVGEDQLLAAHMLQHLLLGDLGPLLIVLGLRGPLGVFLLPPRVLRAFARTPLRAVVSFLLRPGVSFAVWAAAFVGWHVPAAYDAALARPAVHIVEHACFAIAGLLAWTQIIDPARRRRLSVGQRAMFAFGMLVVSGLVAEVLVATHPLYPYYTHVQDRPFDWTAGQDQSRAALLMMAEQIATLGAAMAFLVRAHVERVAPEVPGFGKR